MSWGQNQWQGIGGRTGTEPGQVRLESTRDWGQEVLLIMVDIMGGENH